MRISEARGIVFLLLVVVVIEGKIPKHQGFGQYEYESEFLSTSLPNSVVYSPNLFEVVIADIIGELAVKYHKVLTIPKKSINWVATQYNKTTIILLNQTLAKNVTLSLTKTRNSINIGLGGLVIKGNTTVKGMGIAIDLGYQASQLSFSIGFTLLKGQIKLDHLDVNFTIDYLDILGDHTDSSTITYIIDSQKDGMVQSTLKDINKSLLPFIDQINRIPLCKYIPENLFDYLPEMEYIYENNIHYLGLDGEQIRDTLPKMEVHSSHPFISFIVNPESISISIRRIIYQIFEIFGINTYYGTEDSGTKFEEIVGNRRPIEEIFPEFRDKVIYGCDKYKRYDLMDAVCKYLLKYTKQNILGYYGIITNSLQINIATLYYGITMLRGNFYYIYI